MNPNKLKNNPGRPKGVDVIVTPELVNAVKTVRMGSKMKKATDIVVENVRNGRDFVQKDVLLEAGYSENVADSPTRVFNAKPFREILETQLPKNKLSEIHDKLANHKKLTQLDFPMDMEDSDIKAIIEGSGGKLLKLHQVNNAFVGMVKLAYVTIPSPEVILKALDMAYKVSGHYAPTESHNTTIDLVALFNGAMAKRRGNNS